MSVSKAFVCFAASVTFPIGVGQFTTRSQPEGGRLPFEVLFVEEGRDAAFAVVAAAGAGVHAGGEVEGVLDGEVLDVGDHLFGDGHGLGGVLFAEFLGEGGDVVLDVGGGDDAGDHVVADCGVGVDVFAGKEELFGAGLAAFPEEEGHDDGRDKANADF